MYIRKVFMIMYKYCWVHMTSNPDSLVVTQSLHQSLGQIYRYLISVVNVSVSPYEQVTHRCVGRGMSSICILLICCCVHVCTVHVGAWVRPVKETTMSIQMSSDHRLTTSGPEDINTWHPKSTRSIPINHTNMLSVDFLREKKSTFLCSCL